MRITRLKLQNWRNFTHVEMTLGQRAFILGPNASGKSNLLDALKFLRDLVAVGGGLQEAVRLRGGVGEIRSFMARQKSNISLEIDLGDNEVPSLWSYLLEIRAQDKKRPIVVREQVWQEGVEVTTRNESADREDEARLTQTALEQVNANKAFRPIAEFLTSLRYLHVVPQIIRDPSRSAGRDDPFGGDLIERINATSPKTRNARLKRMEEALKIAVPQLSDLELEVDEKGVPHLRAKYNHWRPQGAWQREERFSDGTLRLLGLIWALQEPGGPLLLEEPELSLNDGVVACLAPMFARATRRSKRQVIVTTHSQALLSDSVHLSEIHLLQVDEQGTHVKSAFEVEILTDLVEAGVPVGEAVLPQVTAKSVGQLSFIDLLQS
ncbi:MAG: AAA family ATPase [Hyphomicrobium sp.]